MKYIVTEGQGVIIFSNGFTHSDVEAKMRVKAVGAGMIHISPDEIKCFGESISIGIKSRSEDTDIVIRQIEG